MFFFFKQKTAYEMRISDWSSDVCSSDLRADVITSLSSCGPAKAQLVGRWNGTCNVSRQLPSVEKRRRHQPSQNATHRSPAASMVIPSGEHSPSPNLETTRRFVASPVSFSYHLMICCEVLSEWYTGSQL